MFSDSFHRFIALHKLLDSSGNLPNKGHEGRELLPVLGDGRSARHSRYSMPGCHFAGSNLWIMKPTGMNRGNGIHVFKDLPSLTQLIDTFLSAKVTIKKAKPAKDETSENAKADSASLEAANSSQKNDKEVNDKKHKDEEKKETVSRVVKRKFIVQKYIESPLLIHSRKFDIRMWVLVTHELNTFLFKEGYIRTSSSPFVIDLNDVDNKFVHLTNNAIQKYGEDYGKFEDGNQLSFAQFQDYINIAYPEKNTGVSKDLLPEMKNIIKKSILATRKSLNPENRRHTFELFGYDFIIDSDFNLWLIEVNTNPCLEESSDLLKMLLPRMIDDALKLTVDVLFPPPSQSAYGAVYPVAGYNDQENMW
eukprot:TRINITY_DN5413_c0_g1_i9.p1 TRINITY_DN5413_c0_g1~~TRINITY_DN5413_c0_g1_i9.p1  ORF type:complete len:363 (+),score=99.11 TRINITY_DN5413_c0_g1_i9:1169-2257(+)